MEITEDIIQYINKKYPGDLRKFIQFYKSGLPEKFWNTQEKKEQIKQLNVCSEYLDGKKSILILGTNMGSVNALICMLVKRLIVSNNKCSFHNYSSFMYDVMDKFNNMDKQIYNSYTRNHILCFGGIKPYNHMKNQISMFSSIIDNLLNSNLEKTVVLGMEYDGSLNNLPDIYDSSMIKTINDYFQILEIKG